MRILLICFLFLFLMNVIMILVTGLKYRGLLINHLFHKFYFDSKFNFPSFFNTFLLLLAAGIVYYVHFANSKKYQPDTRWFWLAVLFLAMAVEENVSVHFFLGHLESSYLVWAVPIGLALIFLGIYFGRLAFAIPRRIAIGFFVSGAVYIAGAIVLEFAGARVKSIRGEWNPLYAGISTFEETLEMLGLILFINYLLKYIRLEFPSANLNVK